MYGLDVFLQVVDVVVALVLMFSFYGLTKNKNQKIEKEEEKEKEPWSWFAPKSYEFKVGSSLGAEGTEGADGTEDLEKMKALMVSVVDEQKNNYSWRVFKNRLGEATYWRRWIFWEGEGNKKIIKWRLAQFVLLVVVLVAVFIFLTIKKNWQPSFYITFICLSLLALFFILRFVAYFFISRDVIERYSGSHFYQYVFAFGLEFALFDRLEKVVRKLTRENIGLHIFLVWLFTVLSLSFLIGFISLFWGVIHNDASFFANQFMCHVLPFSLGISTTGLFLSFLTNEKGEKEENGINKTPAQLILEKQTVTRDMMNMWIGFFVVVIWLFYPELKKFGQNRAFKIEYLLLIVSFIFALRTFIN